MISWENYEEYMMLHADGELEPAEVGALMIFIEAHPQLKSELAAYERTRLAPDEAVVYVDKDALLKPEHTRIIALPTWVKYSAAACVAMMVATAAYKYSGRQRSIEVVAFRDTLKSGNTQANVPVKTSPDTTSIAAVVKTTTDQPKPVKKKEVQPRRRGGAPEPEQKRPMVAAISASVLPVAEVKTVACHTSSNMPLSTVDVPAIPAPVTEQEERRSFWDWLPMEDEKKQRFENIASAISDAYDGGKEPAGKKVNVKVENRKIKLIF
jgi:hypothetical protein